MHLSQRKSPRLVAARSRFGGGEVAVRGGEVAVRGDEVTVQGGEVAVQGGEVAVQGSVAPKVQTTSATNVDNAVSWVRWSAMWARRRLASRGARARTAEYAR